MPELPDVAGFRRVAEESVQRRIVAVDVHDEQVLRETTGRHFSEALLQRCFAEPRRHGKWLLLPTADSQGGRGDGFPCVLLHFGMTGMLLWCAQDAQPHAHDRVVFRFDSGELRYRDMRKLTGIQLAQDESDRNRILDDLGPDACEVSPSEFTHLLARTRRQLKPALMDQSALAGLGNLCADEILWRARTHPRRTTTDLSVGDWRRLHRRMRSVLRQSVRVGRVPDHPSWLTGHRDESEGECPRCSTLLSHGRTGGRSTVWCPHCQAR